MKKFTLIALALLTLLGANHGFSAAARGVGIIDRGVDGAPLFAGTRAIFLDEPLAGLDALKNVVVNKLHALGVAAADLNNIRLFDDHDRPINAANVGSILQNINAPVLPVPGAIAEGYPFALIAVQIVPIAIPD